jgi:hypothetical protein
MGFCKLILKSCVLLVLGSALAVAQTSGQPEDTPKEKEPTKAPRISLELLGSKDKVFAWRPIRLQVHVVSGGQPCDLKGVIIHIPIAMGVTHPREKDGEIPVVEDASIQLAELGENWRSDVIELRKKSFREMGSLAMSVMAYTPRDEVFQATMIYRDGADPDGRDYYQDGQLPLHVEAHPLGMFLGAVVGAFLSALLRVLMVVRRHISSDDPSADYPGASKLLGSFFLSVFTGVVASGIAILVFQSTSNIDFAIAVTVKDFYGGVLLGLFGEKVAQAIYQRVTAPEGGSQQERREEESLSAPESAANP